MSESPPDRLVRFENLFTCHHDPVLRYVVRRLDLREDAADLVAETFLVAWRRLDDVPKDQALPWLYGVARRVLANHRRGETRRHGLADKLRDDLRATPAVSEPTFELQYVAEAFRQLSDADRELLSLVAWEGLDTAQLATTLGCSRGTAAVRLHRARRRLERLIDRSTSGRVTAVPARGEHS
ncbi:RNA polymerase sigma-70 factor (ECF subfamily) [Kribbella steppae]|uniref:RNA polymerase sigma-70 factor (ECF subfamily) n=1 Tax=Kribbella steppae TaxID=2512223 RepID=A0A4R2HFU5_9ACTN|nr:sigma-70 family RNA polymerase sigma factor [Kribbella steppae]TCO26406.1 RNA polymerase sigma-70 factor (ECF subfamily) [Kribbella steppae]